MRATCTRRLSLHNSAGSSGGRSIREIVISSDAALRQRRRVALLLSVTLIVMALDTVYLSWQFTALLAGWFWLWQFGWFVAELSRVLARAG